MAYGLVSSDGLVSSNDPSFINLWNDITRRQRAEREMWARDMVSMGAKVVMADDGWVKRDRNELTVPDYADVRGALVRFDLVALGGPGEWRLVRIDGHRDNPFNPGPAGRVYSFTQIEGRANA